MPPFQRLLVYALVFCAVPALPFALLLEFQRVIESVGWWYTVSFALGIALVGALVVSGLLTFVASRFPTNAKGVLRTTCGWASVAFILFAGWSLMWVFSSASLACLPCDCTYSFLAPQPQCRQPLVALVTCIGSVALFVWAAVVATRRQG